VVSFHMPSDGQFSVAVDTFGVRRLLGLQLPLPRTLIAGVNAYWPVSPIINAIARPGNIS